MLEVELAAMQDQMKGVLDLNRTQQVRAGSAGQPSGAQTSISIVSCRSIPSSSAVRQGRAKFPGGWLDAPDHRRNCSNAIQGARPGHPQPVPTGLTGAFMSLGTSRNITASGIFLLFMQQAAVH